MIRNWWFLVEHVYTYLFPILVWMLYICFCFCFCFPLILFLLVFLLIRFVCFLPFSICLLFLLFLLHFFLFSRPLFVSSGVGEALALTPHVSAPDCSSCCSGRRHSLTSLPFPPSTKAHLTACTWTDYAYATFSWATKRKWNLCYAQPI